MTSSQIHEEHEHVKYRLEQAAKKYAPYVPEIQTLMIPPKGKYCNADYKFCPNFLYGGYCKELNVKLMSVDGGEFTTITDVQFWDCFDKERKPQDAGDHNVAVGCYTVYKKKCGIK